MEEESPPKTNFDYLKTKKGVDDLLSMRQKPKHSYLRGRETTEITDFVIHESFAFDEETD